MASRSTSRRSMANVSIARRYARALIDVGAETNKLDRYGEELSRFAAVLESNKELADVMSNPAYSRVERLAVTDAVMKSLGTVDGEVANFLKLLVDRNRVIFLPDIARLYRDLADARMGRLRGRVTSAAALPAESVARIAKILESMTHRQVVLDTKVDPALLGGVSAQVGAVLYDGSIRTQLEELRREMTE